MRLTAVPSPTLRRDAHASRGPEPVTQHRNPMYAGLALAYLGLALFVGSWWPLVAMPVVLLVVARLAIRPEERYLTQRYGATYADYQHRVRRWL
jgi:protein-S-isoprenylcysteine O-methyltransferase Ste14